MGRKNKDSQFQVNPKSTNLIKCPDCQETFEKSRQALRVHFRKMHAEISVGERERKLDSMFGAGRGSRRNRSHINAAGFIVNEMPVITVDSHKPYFVDEYGVVHGMDEASSLIEPAVNRAPGGKEIEERKFGYCPVCKKTVLDAGKHCREVHWVVPARGKFRCLQCNEVINPENVQVHACIVKMQGARLPLYEVPASTTSYICECEICGYKYPAAFHHTAIYHPANKENTCLCCKEIVPPSMSMDEHLQQKHDVEMIMRGENNLERSPNPRLLVCTLCGMRLHPADVQAHQKKHPKPPKHDMINRVLQATADIKPVEKKDEPRPEQNPPGLIERMRRISNYRRGYSKNAVCNICGKLIGKDQMDQHLTMVHRPVPVTPQTGPVWCKICQIRVPQSDWQEHQLWHAKNPVQQKFETLLCPVCGFRVAFDGIKIHLMEEHPGFPIEQLKEVL